MKYTEEQIKNLLSADLSGESKIKESLKFKLLNQNAAQPDKKRFALGAAFLAATAVLMVFVLTTGKKREEYTYNQYPMAPIMQVTDNYGASGPRGLNLTEVNL